MEKKVISIILCSMPSALPHPANEKKNQTKKNGTKEEKIKPTPHTLK